MSTKRKPKPDAIPVGGLSMWDPVFVGMDEYHRQLCLDLVFHNVLLSGEPGAGKSVMLNNIVAHGALSVDCDLCLFDGKWVELGPYAPIADVFVGPDVDEAIYHLELLQGELDARYEELGLSRVRKISRDDGKRIKLVTIDEIALYSATLGTEVTQKRFSALLRDLVARGRAAGMPVIGATQRPTADIIPTSLRDIFGYRCAFRCTTDVSSDVVLGYGWVKEGYSAKSIAPEDRGVGLLLAEGGIPRRFRSAYLSDEDIYHVVDYAAWIRSGTTVAA